MLTKNLAKQLRGTVSNPSLTSEVWSGVDEDDHPDDPLDGIQPTGNISCGCDGIEGSGASGLSGLLSGDSVSYLADGSQLTVNKR